MGDKLRSYDPAHPNTQLLGRCYTHELNTNPGAESDSMARLQSCLANCVELMLLRYTLPRHRVGGEPDMAVPQEQT